MEEWVGQLWHRVVTRAARHEYPQAAVSLDEVRQPVAVLFRALGGDAGLRIEAANETANSARRRLLSRIAGTDRTLTLAWRNADSLRLPPQLACYPERDLNRQLYLWLAALAAQDGRYSGDWLQRSAQATAELLEAHPGLRRRYRLLVERHLQQRPALQTLSSDEAEQEQVIRTALLDPAQAVPLPCTSVTPLSVPLWLHPEPPVEPAATIPVGDDDGEDNEEGHSEQVETDKRRSGKRVAAPDGRDGLIAFRLESLFTRAEYANVDRTTEENEDEDAGSALEDQDTISLARDRQRTATRLRFDLDLPPEDNDDLYLGEGLPLPEWDYRQQRLLPEHCRLQLMQARDAEPCGVPARLQVRARRLRRLFEAYRTRRHWRNAQPDGNEVDLDALIDFRTERLRGVRRGATGLYRQLHQSGRDLSCLLLADLSLSTDAHVNNDQRVIDVVRDSLFLFSEALAATGDRFALCGFSSRRRSHVRFHSLKTFDEACSDRVRGRIQAIRPGYYTRMGAAIRHATRLLDREQAGSKLLLLLTDGKPNDLDRYEGRYGIEDTRRAIHEAAELGVRPFCVTIDSKAGEYLPYLFGSASYIQIRNAGELPARLPMLYGRLTAA